MTLLQRVVLSGIALGFAVGGSSTRAVAQHAASSGTPRTLSYQGVLYNSGAPLSGDQRVTISLYADEAATKLVWRDNFTVNAQNGLFQAALGSNLPLPESSELDKAGWLGVRVGEEAEMRPLTRLTSAVSALTVADNSITANKIAADYVGSITVNGQKVTGKGTDLKLYAGDGLAIQYDEASQSIILKGSTGQTSQKGHDVLGNNLDVKGDAVIHGNTTLGDDNTLTITFNAKSATDLDMATHKLTHVGQLLLNNATNSNQITLVAAVPSANRTYTFPDAGAASNVVLSEGAQTINGTKTFGSTISGSINGNAATVTNGIYTTGSYANPSWLTSLASTKVTGNFPIAQITNLSSSLTANATAITDETTRASAAESTLQSNINSEITLRSAGDATTLSSAHTYSDALMASEVASRSAADVSTLSTASSYTDTKVGIEAATRASAVSAEATARATAVTNEASARTSGDASTITSANGYTDTQIATEAASRSSADATEASARASAVSAEAAARASAVSSEAALRAAGDASLSAAANAYTNAQVALEATARADGDQATLDAAHYDALVLVMSEEELLESDLQQERGNRIDADAITYSDATIYADNVVAGEASTRDAQVSNVLGDAQTYTDDAVNTSAATLQVSIDAKADNNAVVHLTGNESVSGEKTFSDGVVVSSSLGGSGTPAAGGHYADNMIIAWGDVSVSGGVLTVNDQFGNCTLNRTSTGHYTVTLPNSPTACVCTVTPKIMVLALANRSGDTISITTCNTAGTSTDAGFSYIVTGRP